ncbi:MAG: hypothetical protein QF835_07480 [Candidatus Marinimicrobia bacterium]|nr:hypothetical protein [Candidatus Neomarinimicrobiota bacterium]MDP6820454.1 hypothetical protein [Candidatus Neomarinimicrobiota bacterium]|tara:strand:+ start:3312 stop:6347 length:3036 start_codon:yes stop_codon:yes gene_type:complete
MRKSYTFGNNLKVNLRQIARKWQTGILHTFLAVFLMAAVACDFDIPEKFEMPVWYLDLKIPLVNSKYEMTDISNPDIGIFPTPDSMGFQIVQSGEMEPQVLPTLPTLPMDVDSDISTGELPGIPSANIVIPFPEIGQSIPLTDPGILYPTSTLGQFFQFPTTDTVVMNASDYEQLIITPFNTVMQTLLNVLNLQIPIPFNAIDLSFTPMIASIDTLIMGEGSRYISYFENNSATELIQVYSNIVTGTTDITDTLANHNGQPILSYGQSYADTTDLSGKGLCPVMNVATSLQLASPESEFVVIPPSQSLFVDFSVQLVVAGFDSIDITTSNYSLSDIVTIPSLDFPEMDMSESGISKMEIFRCQLREIGALYNENRVHITGLESTLPFDLKFLMNFKNFAPDEGGDSVKIDTVLKRGSPVDKTFDMRGYSIAAPGYPNTNSPLNSFDLDFDIGFVEQKTSIPLDGSSFGHFSMRMQMELLSFSLLEADLFMLLPTDSTVQEFPPGLTGAIPTEALFEITMKSQIPLPIRMKLDFKGYNSLGELTYVSINVDTLARIPDDAMPWDTALTIIGLDKHGTRITIYDSVDDTLPSYDVLTPPCDTCASIIGLLGSNPVQLVIDPEVKVEGRGALVEGKAIQGGFIVTIPFALQLEPMTFMGGIGSEIDFGEYDTRYKIRNSLIHSDMITTITNSFPFGAELSVLMSNLETFPVGKTPELLKNYVDTLSTLGLADSTTDSVYIVARCSDLNLDSSEIYIFNVMSDYSECVDRLPYLVKTNGSGTDTVVAYVDTLFKFLLPSPEELYGADDTLGYPEGMVAVPGSGTYYSTIDTNKIFLMTKYGSIPYVMPRFHIPGTGGTGVFLSKEDYLEINSFITFRLSSGGISGSADDVLVITYPNGGQTFYTGQTDSIVWESFGGGVGSVDLYYANEESDPDSIDVNVESDWTSIASGIINVDGENTYAWTPSGLAVTDSLRLRIVSSDGKARDINGWYIKISNPAGTSAPRFTTIRPRLVKR